MNVGFIGLGLMGGSMALNLQAAGHTLAYARAKELYNRALSQPLEAQLEEERQGIARSGGTHDFREGVRAFLDKRPARFEGR